MSLLGKEEQEQIKAAIRKSERETSGEIRVCIEEHCPEEVLDRAAWYFDQMEMQRTAARNGVLIYVALSDRQLAIIGDAGINAVVGNAFWSEARDAMIARFREGRIVEGLTEGIGLAGTALRKYFPCAPDDRNELPDDVVIGNSRLQDEDQ